MTLGSIALSEPLSWNANGCGLAEGWLNDVERIPTVDMVLKLISFYFGLVGDRSSWRGLTSFAHLRYAPPLLRHSWRWHFQRNAIPASPLVGRACPSSPVFRGNNGVKQSRPPFYGVSPWKNLLGNPVALQDYHSSMNNTVLRPDLSPRALATSLDRFHYC